MRRNARILIALAAYPSPCALPPRLRQESKKPNTKQELIAANIKLLGRVHTNLSASTISVK